MRLLIWDFDGTLGFRASGAWASALAEAAGKEVPSMRVAAEELVPHLQSGFPWHRPGRSHPEIQSGEAWWGALYPILESAFRSVGADLDRASSLARAARRLCVDPSRWRLLPHALGTLDRLGQAG